MNIVLDKYNFNKNNLFLSDTKKNMVLDGNFTKIIYSDFACTMNSVYIVYPIFRYYVDKNILYFQLNDINTENINWFSSIESHILNLYSKENAIHKNKVYALYSQIITGKIKIHKDFMGNMSNINNSSALHSNAINQTQSGQANFIILKISGVWENANNIGITYKFIYPA